MKGSIKDILGIPGVHGYILAAKDNIQVKLPSRFELKDSKNRIGKLFNDIIQGKDFAGNLIEIYAYDMSIVIFCSSEPILAIIASNTAPLSLIRITGKLVYAGITGEAKQ